MIPQDCAEVLSTAVPRSALWGTLAPTLREREEGAPRYERVARIATGGMGVVWLGWDTRLERHVALKVPRADVRGASDLLAREATLAARLDHPGVVTVHDIVEIDGERVFVMAWVPGRTLAAVLQATSTPAERVRWLSAFVGAVDGVAHAHANGVCHRDLSPRNLLAGDDGLLRVIDWGIAAPTGCTDSPPAGTPGYVAPEQLDGVPPAPQGDVYALGCCLLALLGGVDPEGRPRALRSVAPDLLAIAYRATARDPLDRYPDAAALSEDLRAWLEGGRVDAYAAPAWRMGARLVSRFRVPITAALIAVALVVAALVWGRNAARREAERAIAAEERAHASAIAASNAALQARRELAASLAVRSVEAWRRGDLYDAVESSRAALAVDPDDPNARGVIALARALPRFEPDRVLELPACPRWKLMGDLERVACLRGSSWSVHHLAPDLPRVETGFEVPHMTNGDPQGPTDLRVRGDHVLVRTMDTDLTVFDRRTGALVDHRRSLHYFSDARAPVWYATGRDASDPHPPCEPPFTAWLDAGPLGIHAACGRSQVFRRAETGAWEPVGPTDTPVRALAAVDGRVWAGTTAGDVFPLDASSPGVRLGEPVTSLASLGIRSWVVARGWSGATWVVDLALREVVASLPPTTDEVVVLESAEDVVRLRALHGERLVDWRLPVEAPRLPHRAADGFSRVAFGPDGTRLVATNGYGTLHWAELRAGQRERVWGVVPWIRHPALDARFEASGDVVWVVGSPDAGLGRFDWAMREIHSMPTFGTVVHPAHPSIAVLADGTRILGAFGSVQLRQRAGEPPEALAPVDHPRNVHAPPAHDVAVVCGHGMALLGSDGEGRRLVSSEVMFRACALDVSHRVAGLSHDGRRILVRTPDAEERWTDLSEEALSVALAPEVVLVGRMDGWIDVRSSDGTRVLARAPAHRERVAGLDIDRDGEWAASASWDGSVRFLHVPTATSTP